MSDVFIALPGYRTGLFMSISRVFWIEIVIEGITFFFSRKTIDNDQIHPDFTIGVK